MVKGEFKLKQLHLKSALSPVEGAHNDKEPKSLPLTQPMCSQLRHMGCEGGQETPMASPRHGRNHHLVVKINVLWHR